MIAINIVFVQTQNPIRSQHCTPTHLAHKSLCQRCIAFPDICAGWHAVGSPLTGFINRHGCIDRVTNDWCEAEYNSTLETQKAAAAIRLPLKSQNTED